MEIVLSLTCVVIMIIALVGAIRFVRELDAQERRHAEAMAELSAKVDRLERHNAELEALEERHTAELRAQTDLHSVELRTLTRRHAAELEALTERGVTDLSARLDALVEEVTRLSDSAASPPPDDPPPPSPPAPLDDPSPSSPAPEEASVPAQREWLSRFPAEGVVGGLVECGGRVRQALAEQYEALLAGLSVEVVSRLEVAGAIRYELRVPTDADLADLPLADDGHAELAWCMLAAMKDLPSALVVIEGLRIEVSGGCLRWGKRDVTAMAADRLG